MADINQLKWLIDGDTPCSVCPICGGRVEIIRREYEGGGFEVLPQCTKCKEEFHPPAPIV